MGKDRWGCAVRLLLWTAVAILAAILVLVALMPFGVDWGWVGDSATE